MIMVEVAAMMAEEEVVVVVVQVQVELGKPPKQKIIVMHLIINKLEQNENVENVNKKVIQKQNVLINSFVQ